MASAALWPYSAERLFFICSFETPAGVSKLLFHGRGRRGKRQVQRLFPAETVALRGRTRILAGSTPSVCSLSSQPPSPRGRLFAVAGNFAAAPKGAPLGELAKPQALTEGVNYNKKETTAQKLCNGFSCYCIKQSEQDQTSSRTAISAASPRRAPILMMRV